MKKIFLVSLILVTIIPSIIRAQEIQLADEYLVEYNRQKLSLEILGKGFGPITVNQPMGTLSSTAWKNWQAYHGFNKISEDIFFMIAGLEYEASMARQYHNRTRMLLIGGLAGVSSGIGLLFYSFSGNNTSLIRWGGITLACVGSVPLVFSMGRHNWSPVNKAEEAKEEYNKKLLDKFMNNN
jgi:hypothetical protein